jgi:hypothetical protein
MTKNIPVNRYPQAFDALYVRMPDGSYKAVNSGGGGSGPDGSVTWNDIEGKPDSVNVDTRDRANHTGTQTASTIVDLPDVLANKVDAVPGKVLSDSNFTQAEKEKLAGLEDGHFKGVHVGLAGLTAAHPTGEAGDYAVVDDGETLTWYQWSDADTDWTPRTGESTEITPAQVKQYYEQNPDTNAFTDDEKARLADLGATGRFTMRRIGTWNAETNTPTLIDGTGNPGDYYVVTVAGTQSFGSFTYDFSQYDWVMYSGGTWQRLAVNPSASTWSSLSGKPQLTNTVNGKSGTVVLTAADVGALPDNYVPPAAGVTSFNGSSGAITYAPTWGDVTSKPDLVVKRGGMSPAIPAALLRRSTEISYPRGRQVVAWNQTVYDNFSGVSDGTYVVPEWANFARITVYIRLTVTSDDQYLYAYAVKNGVDVAMVGHPVAGNTSQTAVAISPIVPVVSGDVLTGALYHNSSGSRTLVHGESGVYMQIELFEGA